MRTLCVAPASSQTRTLFSAYYRQTTGKKCKSVSLGFGDIAVCSIRLTQMYVYAARRLAAFGERDREVQSSSLGKKERGHCTECLVMA